MLSKLRRWVWRIALVGFCGQLFQAGCLGAVQREMGILFAPEGSLDSLWNSQLIKLFGPDILQFW